ncbi:hypothetical protein JXB11_02990 [Candidatus Woesearchaeota archaeon]|nr:hypothetical protein [Candidatus Woesearchaeota archaeon]
MTVKEKYSGMCRKYKLPPFEKLDAEFELSGIEQEDFILREVRKKIEEKLAAVRKVMEEVLQPESNLAGIYESRVFSEEEKKELFELYRKIMKFVRQGFELYVKADEKADANFISAFFREWESIKAGIGKMSSKLQDSWQKEMEGDEKLGYFG